MSERTWVRDTAKLRDLELWEQNPKYLTARAGQALQASWDDMGQYQTLAIGPNGECYDGHQRVLTLMAAYGGDYEVEVMRSTWVLSDAERRRIIAESSWTAVGRIDADVLAGWPEQDLLDAGFNGDLLQEMNEDAATVRVWLEAQEDEEIPADPGAQIDRAEELQEKWGVQVGDIWQIGEHLVICGDCRGAATWQRLLSAAGADKVNGVFTSPPYAEQRKKQYGGVPVAEYVEWWGAVQSNAREHLAGDGSFFVNIKPHCEKGERVLYVFDLVLAMKRRWGWRFVDEFCRLVQTTPGKWPNRFKNGFEPVYHFSFIDFKFRPGNVSWRGESFRADGKTHYDGKSAIRGITDRFEGQVLPSNVVEARAGEGNHPAVFSVALPAFFVKAYSDKGDTWLDPFLGSGTTIVAAHQNERRGLGIERLEKYVAVTLERLAEVTGLTPERLG